MSYAVIVDKLSKQYQIGRVERYRMLQDTLISWAQGLFRKKLSPQEPIWALKDVSLTINTGEVVGIIGRNGAGKSTLLKVLSKITFPTSGAVKVQGRVASLLEVGTGFHEELTGRENVMLNGSILGMRKADVLSKMDDIVAFAGVEKFIDTPIKRYSSGMRLRLGFAVAAHLDPDILIIDEVLAVGDAGFQKKCLGAMEGLRTAGRTVLFVSHNMAAVENLCSRVIWIDNGQVRKDGDPKQVIEEYLDSFSTGQVACLDLNKIEKRRGNGQARLTRLTILSEDGQPVKSFRTGQPVVIRVHYATKTSIPSPVFAVRIYTELGTLVSEMSTWADDFEIPSIELGEGCIDLEIERLNLMPGRYHLSLLLGAVGPVVFDAVDYCSTFEVDSSNVNNSGKGIDSRFGIVYFPSKWIFNGAHHSNGVPAVSADRG